MLLDGMGHRREPGPLDRKVDGRATRDNDPIWKYVSGRGPSKIIGAKVLTIKILLAADLLGRTTLMSASVAQQK